MIIDVVGRLWLFLLLTWLTQNPLLALIVVLLLGAGSYGFFGARFIGGGAPLRESRARRALERTLAVNPHDLTARAELGRLLVRKGRDAAALTVLAPVIERLPELAGARADFGLALVRSGGVAEGERHLEAALALDPKLRYGEPLLRWAEAAGRRGDHVRAIRLLEEHRQLHSSSVEGLYKLARASLRMGDRAMARATVEDALAAHRTSPRFKRRLERRWWLASHLLRWRLRPASASRFRDSGDLR